MPGLDGLRGVAILLVIATHCLRGWIVALYVVRDASDVTPGFVVPVWVDMIAGNGELGVPLFFVISAFTLTNRLSEPGGGRGYALRRIARVGPGYWLALLGYMALAGFAPRGDAPFGVAWTDVAAAAVFGSAWYGGPSYVVVPGGWSVSSEVSFYLVLPFVLRVIDGRVWRALLMAVVVAVLVQMRGRHAILTDTVNQVTYFSPLHHAADFMFGIVAALVARRYQIPPMKWLALLVVVVLVVVLPFLQWDPWILLPHMRFAAVAAVAVALAGAHPPAILAGPIMRRIGEVSYSMYLVHFAILAVSMDIASRIAPTQDWRTFLVHFGVTTGLAFAIACVTYRWVELPAIRWAARWSGSAKAVPSAA